MFERFLKNNTKKKNNNKNKKNKIKPAALFTFAVTVLGGLATGGCGSFDAGENLIQSQWQLGGSETYSMENEAVLDYEVPKMTPGILVDRKGYSSNEIVTAFVYSGKLPEEYALEDPEGNEVLKCNR